MLDNMFMGGTCVIERPPSTLLYHRVPYNFETLKIKVGLGIGVLHSYGAVVTSR